MSLYVKPAVIVALLLFAAVVHGQEPAPDNDSWRWAFPAFAGTGSVFISSDTGTSGIISNGNTTLTPTNSAVTMGLPPQPFREDNDGNIVIDCKVKDVISGGGQYNVYYEAFGHIAARLCDGAKIIFTNSNGQGK